jgi:hypothetical protein
MKGDNAESIACDVLTLDEFVDSRQMSSVDLVKMDVEGGEYDVLSGATHVLNAFHPAIYLEINPSALSAAGATPLDVFRLLTEHGYRIWKTDQSDLFKRLRLLPVREGDLTGATEFANWLAVHRRQTAA